MQSNWKLGLLNFDAPDITSKVEAAIQAFEKKSWADSGEQFLNVYRQLEGLCQQERLNISNLGLGDGSLGIGPFVGGLGLHFHKRRQILKEWALRALHDAAIAFFAHRGEDSPNNAIITALKNCKATLKIAHGYCVNDIEYRPGNNITELIPVIDMIGQAIQKATNSLEVATVLASLCLQSCFSFPKIEPSIRSNMLCVLIHSTVGCGYKIALYLSLRMPGRLPMLKLLSEVGGSREVEILQRRIHSS